MEAKIRSIQEYHLLRELERKYNVREVKYDILNYRFEYLHMDEVKTIDLEKMIGHLYQDVPKDEVLLKLEAVVDNYLPQYLNEQISLYYASRGIELPTSLYLFKGLIQFIDSRGNSYYVPFDRELEQIFKQFNIIEKGVEAVYGQKK